jgi:hypothetical protein
MKYVGLFVTVITLTFVEAIFRGWVITYLWGWFIAPLFGLPLLTIPYAIGLTFTARVMLDTGQESKSDGGLTEKFLTSIILSLLLLGVGWIIQLFV